MRTVSTLVAAALLTLVPLSGGDCGAGFRAEAQRGCCRVCTRGKACGDSCIARHLNCRKGRGCACDAR